MSVWLRKIVQPKELHFKAVAGSNGWDEREQRISESLSAKMLASLMFKNSASREIFRVVIFLEVPNRYLSDDKGQNSQPAVAI
jgi:hypothetical protein